MICLRVWRFSVVNDCLASLTGPTLWTARNLKPSTLTLISVRTFLNKASVFSSSVSLTFKGQLQRFYKLMSYERAFKMLKNDMCITEIQAVLEL